MKNKGICLITFSNNADHQIDIYSMYDALKAKADVYTIGIKNPKALSNPDLERNLLYDCPLRPGIEKQTFRFDILIKIACDIRRLKIRYLYFESMHIWNAFLMFLCPQCVKIVAVHDVIPHDGNRAMDLANFVTCKMSNHIILRNKKYKDTLVSRLHVPAEKITSFDLWRCFPSETPVAGGGLFLCFGRIRKYKGLDLLVKIIEKSPKAKFRIVGDADNESQVYVDRLKQYQNVEIIAREVSQEELEMHFRECDWVILPYSEATQSGVILDACRFARPYICFDVGAISEQIIDGETGFLIPQRDVDAFAKKIEQVRGYSLDQLYVMSHNSYMFGYDKYAANAVADEFLKVICSCHK